MTDDGPSLGADTSRELLRRLDILIGLLAVVVAFLGVLVAEVVSGSFIPTFMMTLLFGLGIVAIVRSLLE